MDKVRSHQAILRGLRYRLFRNSGLQLIGNSRTRSISMILVCLIVWIVVFAGSWWGFSVLKTTRLFPSGRIMELIFSSLFLMLGGMLVFSTSLVLYAGLFNGAETRFLLTTPIRADHIFAMKYQSAMFYSSWAFVVLGAPVLIAYGISYGVPWYFYPALLFFFTGYILLPSALGGGACLLFVNLFPKRRKQALIFVIIALILLSLIWLGRTLFVIRAGAGTRDGIENVFGMFALAHTPYSPSQWIAQGLVALADHRWQESILPLMLIWTNGLMGYVLVTFAAKKYYRRGFDRLSAFGEKKKSYTVYRPSWMDRVMEWLVFYLDKPTRLLIIKDFRTFRREPAQVGQLAIFTGLLLLAVLNLRNFFDADIPNSFRHGLSLINMSSTGLLMCAYLSRFIYPLISLEGRKFWILGLLPVKRSQILWGKFIFALTGSTLLAGGIILISDLLLEMPLIAVLIHVFTMLLLSFSMSGLAVGLSALLPNFRETDPSKIVLGFGGTMNMVISLAVLILIVATACGPYHVAATAEIIGLTEQKQELPLWAFAGLPFALALAILGTWLPMRMGRRAFEAIEF